MGRKHAVAVMTAVAFLSSAILAAGARPSLIVQQGDTLSYDLTLELQTHPRGGETAVGSSDSTVAGSAVITGLRVEDSGAARARLDLLLHFSGASAPQLRSDRLQLEIEPGGAMQAQSGDASLLSYVDAISEAAADFGDQNLHVREVLHPSLLIEVGSFVEANVNASVAAATRYRGYPVYAIAFTGGGMLHEGSGSAAVTESYTYAGTMYYDRRDRVLVGETYRASGDVRSDAGGGQYLVVTTDNLLLHSLQRSAAAIPTPTPASVAASPSPEESPSPTPFLPGGYYTPPPPSPSPSGPTLQR
jgi:hypothetical protein